MASLPKIGDSVEVGAGATLAQALLNRLFINGVRRVFGLPGVHNLAFWEASGQIPKIIGVRHEQSTGYAADGFARTSGGLGVAITTTGPGAANVVAAFGEAAVSHSRIIVLASEVSNVLRKPGVSRGILHEMRNQSELFAPLASRDDDGTVLSFSTTSSDEALATLERTLHFAERYGEVAAYIGVPADFLASVVIAQDALLPLDIPIVESGKNRQSFLAAAEMINASKRPVVWCGGGTVQIEAAALTTFAERVNAPVVTSFAGKGVLAGHELLVGGPIHEPEIHRVMADADLLIVLGSDFDGMNTRNWQLPIPERVVAINHRVEPVATNLPGALIVEASLQEIDQLTSLITSKSRWLTNPSVTGQLMRSRLLTDDRAKVGMDIVTEVEQSWPDSANIVCDMTTSGYWIAGYARQPRPRRLAYPIGWGTLGFGFPAAIGAAYHSPTLAMCGDGGVMFALGELATLVQEQIPLTLFIVDDGGYGMLRFDQQSFGHAERGVDLVTPDWVALSASFGISSTKIDEPSQLGRALRVGYKRNQAGHPHIIILNTVIYPPRTTSPRWRESME